MYDEGGMPIGSFRHSGFAIRHFTKGQSHMARITIDDALHERAKQAAVAAGYSGVDEFVTHCIENELRRLNVEESERQVADQLRGLGYIE